MVLTTYQNGRTMQSLDIILPQRTWIVLQEMSRKFKESEAADTSSEEVTRSMTTKFQTYMML